MDESLCKAYLAKRVVLDTSGPLIYIGTLVELTQYGYWLKDVDVHDRNDGHSSKEQYIASAADLERDGTRRINRRRTFVERGAVVSISSLDEVVAEDALDEPNEENAA